MRKDKRKIIYVPEPDQHNIALAVRDALVKDIIACGILADDLVKRYNELRNVERHQTEKIIQINGR